MNTIALSSKSRIVTSWGQLQADKILTRDELIDWCSTFILQHLENQQRENITIHKKWVKENIARQLGTKNTNLGRLLKVLNEIHFVLLSDSYYATDISVQAGMAERMVEGLANCGQGFENRMNDMLRQMQFPKNLEESLELMRTEIVARVSRLLSNEVHAQNRVTQIAATKFGIKPISSHDKYIGNNQKSNSIILELIEDAFAANYTVLLVLKHIEEECRNVFAINGYKGPSQSTEGYTAVYLKWLEHLDRWLPPASIEGNDEDNDENNYSVYLQITKEGPNEAPCVKDVNWTVVRANILKQLVKDGLLDASNEAIDMFEILPQNQAEMEYWLSCGPNEQQIQKWLSCNNQMWLSGNAQKQFCNLLLHLPEGHPYIDKEMKRYADKSKGEHFKCLTEHLRHDKSPFKSKLFISRMRTLLCMLHDKQQLIEFLNLEDSKQSFLSILLSNGSIDDLQALCEVLRREFTSEMIEKILNQTNKNNESVWFQALHSPEKMTILINLASSLSIKPLEKLILDKWNSLSQNPAQYNKDNKMALWALMLYLNTPLKSTETLRLLATKAFELKEQKVILSALIKLIELAKELPNETQALIFNPMCKVEYNVLMLAARYQPSAVPELFELVSKLSESDKAAILSQKTGDESNALILAAQYQPDALPNLVELLLQLPEAKQRAILSQKRRQGRNALMLAAQYNPDALPKLFELLVQLPKDAQQDILSQKDDKGSNALMLAAQYQPSAVSKLVELLPQLPEAKQRAILSQKDDNGSNALMLAARYQPSVLPKLVELVSKLSESDKAAILSQKDREESNALMLAARYQPSALPKLVELVSQLPEAKQRAILSQKNNNESNALMLAACYQPSAVPKLVELVSKLSESDQADILSQKTSNGSNALMLAARYLPSAVPKLVELLAELPKDVQLDILTEKNNTESNALMLAARYQPSAVPKLFKLFAQLPKDAQLAILSQKDDNGSNALMLAARYKSSALPKLVELVSQVPEAEQRAILSQRAGDGWSALMLAKRNLPNEENRRVMAAEFIETLRKIQKNKVLENNAPYEQTNQIVMKFILQYESIFAPEDWLTIAKEGLINADLIKHKKEVVFKQIEDMDNKTQQKTCLTDSTNKETKLGAFFYTQRGFFKCSESAGVLKKLKTLQTKNGPS